LTTAGAVGAEAQETKNLLSNPGAEEGKGDKPAVWFAAHVPADGLRMWRATDMSHGGKASLAISNEHEYEETVCNNWAQKLTDIPAGKVLQLSASVKTEKAEAVNLCVQCWDSSGKKMLAFASTPSFRGDHDWFLARAQPVLVPPKTASIIVRAVLTGKGKVWFDDLALAPADVGPAEPLDEANLLLNPGAEQGIEQDPVAWFAAYMPADGLRMWRATDQAHSGKASLAISNEHEYAKTVCNNWAQEVQAVPAGDTIKLSAYIKTEKAEAANVCIQCWDSDRKKMLAFASTPTFSGDHEWFLARTQPIQVPPKTAAITVRAVLTGKGKVWFDDLSLGLVDQAELGTADVRLFGMWTGYEEGNEDVKFTFVFCEQGVIFVSTAGEAAYATGTTDATKQPHQMEGTIVCYCPFSGAAGLRSLGIYKIEGDTLTLSGNAPGVPEAPPDFGAPGSRTFLLKRQD